MPDEVKDERWHRFMAAQQEVSRELMSAKVGRTIDVIIDEVDAEGAIGRSQWDAPEIDGSVFLNGATDLAPGDIVKATRHQRRRIRPVGRARRAGQQQ